MKKSSKMLAKNQKKCVSLQRAIKKKHTITNLSLTIKNFTTMATKATNNVMDTIFANLAKSGINLSLENSHRSVFKKELIEGLTDTQAKVFRRKIRKMIIAFAETLCNAPTDAKAKAQFNELYKQVYAVNDYTLQSICSENMKEVNKKILQKALEIAKK